ncbi:hypothetical protein [Breoghania sp.]|uniref:hypothetical protein n=1 Tax=Breoghania sp. TaxID=2065378 RepID=UPI0026257B47|nr:hypothetical protein [Breoghania sp.]MDJ0933388.1 hypothetical protein [Breoghania sp.]
MEEVDAHVSIEAIRDGAVMTTVNLHLQHDTVLARSNLATPPNWYKKSGRMKCELWHVDQGPMQSLRLEILQAEDKHDRPDTKGIRSAIPTTWTSCAWRTRRRYPGLRSFRALTGPSLQAKRAGIFFWNAQNGPRWPSSWPARPVACLLSRS